MFHDNFVEIGLSTLTYDVSSLFNTFHAWHCIDVGHKEKNQQTTNAMFSWTIASNVENKINEELHVCEESIGEG